MGDVTHVSRTKLRKVLGNDAETTMADLVDPKLVCLLPGRAAPEVVWRPQGSQGFSSPGLGLQSRRCAPYIGPKILECYVLSCCEVKMPKDCFSELLGLLYSTFLMTCRLSRRTSNMRFSTRSRSESTTSPNVLRMVLMCAPWWWWWF